MRVTVLVSDRAAWALGVAQAWARAGDAVTLVLLDAAAATARPEHADAHSLAAALAGGVRVAVHDAALRRRALRVLAEGVTIVDLDEVAELVTAGADRSVWL